jgi:predicted amidohydrolase
MTAVAAPLPTAGVALARAVPWVCREAIAPRVRADGPHGAPDAVWTESNGSPACYGGWQLDFLVGGGAGDLFRLELEAETEDLGRGSDALAVEAFWFGPEDSGGDESGMDWDPVLLEDAAPTPGADGGNARFRYAKQLRRPPGANRLAVRCGLRWAPRGRARWSGWRLTPTPQRPPRTLRLGVASGRPARWTSMEANVAHYVEQCRRAGEAGVDLVCLPETILSWGKPGRLPEDTHAASVPLPGPWLEPFQAVAREHRMGICFSVYERAGANGEVVYNTGILLGRDGALIGTYRKVHLAVMEVRRGVTAGDGFPVFDFDGVRVGMAICMDSSAAETYRILAQRGAEVVLMPIMGDFRATPWIKGAQTLHVERWKLIQGAHAFDNHLYVVAARNVNEGSAITAPWGEVLAYNEGDRDVIWADVDVDERREHPLGTSIQAVLWAMRRPAVYGSLADAHAPVGTAALRGSTTAEA